MDDVARAGEYSWGDYTVRCPSDYEMIAYKKNEPTITHDIDLKSNRLPAESAHRLYYCRVLRELLSTIQLSRPDSPESTHSSIFLSSSTPSSSSSLPLTTPSHSPSPSSSSEDNDRYPNPETIPIISPTIAALDLATLRSHGRKGKLNAKKNERHCPNLMQIYEESYNQFINRKKPELPRCLYGSRRKLDQRGDDRLSGVCWFHRLNVGRGREDCRRERGRRMR